MREKLYIPSKAVNRIVGNVTIDYTDPVTGRVKERIQDHNHEFIDQFASLAWDTILSLTTAETLFMTDDNTPPDDNFQYLRGNIVGWGMNGADASGTYRGKYVADKSFNRQPFASDEGYGYRWKYVYDFTPSQVPGKIGSIGITAQYMNFSSANNPVYPVKRFRYTTEANYYIYKGQWGYRIDNTGIITVYNPLSNEKYTVDVSAVTGTAHTLCLGFNYSNGKAYILAYHSTAANRRMYEFLDEEFSVLLNTYSPSSIAAYPSTTKVFAVYDNYYYYWNSGWYRGDFAENVNAVLQPVPVCPYIASAATGQVGSIAGHDDYIYVFNNGNSTSYRHLIWDAKENRSVASINAATTSSAYQQQCPEDPTTANRLYLLSYYGGYFMYKNALTCYVLPDDAPERPENSGVQITYLVDVTY